MMSSTAHEREVNDLRAAGLNPILSAGGSGAPMAAGAQGTVQDLAKPISAGFDTAIGLRAQNKQFEQIDSTIDNQDADTANKNATADLINNQISSTAQQIRAQSISNDIAAKTKDAAIKKATVEGDWAEFNQYMNAINSATGSAKNLISPLSIMGGKK